MRKLLVAGIAAGSLLLAGCSGGTSGPITQRQLEQSALNECTSIVNSAPYGATPFAQYAQCVASVTKAFGGASAPIHTTSVQLSRVSEKSVGNGVLNDITIDGVRCVTFQGQNTSNFGAISCNWYVVGNP